MNKQKSKNNNGITLIALAITIIVLLILTFVTISSVTGNGILSQANKSRGESNRAEEKNILSASVVCAKNEDNMGNITKENIVKELDKRADEKYELKEINNAEEKAYEVTFKETQNTYVISEDGIIKEKDDYDGNTTLNITPNSVPNLKVNGTSEISISGGILNSSNRTITWTSSDNDIVGIASNSSNTATTDAGVNGKITITVQTSPKEIKLSKTNVEFDMTGTHTDKLTVTYNPTTVNVNGKISWRSDNTGIATVDGSGNITGISNGTTTITAETENHKTATCKVTVHTSPISIALNKGSTTLDLNGTKTEKLTVTFNPSTTDKNNGLTWKSDNTGIVTVDNTGNITAKSNGTATITVTTTNGKTATCKVTVQTSPTSISLNNSSITLDIGGTRTTKLNVNFNPTTSNANNNITWKSDNTGIATVDGSGNVTGVANGTTTIRATTTNEKVATCSVIVQTSPQSISLNQTNAFLDLNDTQSTKLSVNYNLPTSNVNTNITWTSSNSNVASVDSSGNVVGKVNGTATITATTANGKKATCNITVRTSLTSISLDKTKLAFDLSTSTKSAKINVKYTPSTANYNNGVTWSSSNNNVARVDQNGNVTAVGNGGATITATAQNGYTAKCSVGVTTSIISLAVSPTSKTLGPGETVQLTGTKNPSTASEGTQWTSSNTSVATVSNSGLVTAKSVGTATITFKNSASTKSATCKITVTNPIQTKSFTISKIFKNWNHDYDQYPPTNWKTYQTFNLGGSYTIDSIGGSIYCNMTTWQTHEQFTVFGVRIQAYNGSSWDTIYQRTEEYGTWYDSGSDTINESIESFKNIHTVNKRQVMDNKPSTSPSTTNLTKYNKKYSQIRFDVYFSNTLPETLTTYGSISLKCK